ncbi:hypothetical protein PSU4_53190 [Pseudonocardia sulfidoxydans NBRC 16205]|uniref:Uncharacterized protein n=1 Tax=Pseudonocardia sulfidoxydans NBRC 16205 TaxID=1223511 RepID=A0A511DNJ0_9PSEU|nr:hypothetical protein PSU4_53190 [Pseudonocardia sulfidoxydans NBRC 16205]
MIAIRGVQATQASLVRQIGRSPQQGGALGSAYRLGCATSRPFLDRRDREVARRRGQSQPWSRATRAASERLPAPSFCIAEDR